MTKEVGAEQARQQLPKLLDDARRGETTIVTKWGKPYAAIVPLDALPRPREVRSIAALAGSAAGIYPDAADHVRSERDSWE